MQSHISYYKRFLRQASRDLARWGAPQVIGVILAFAILMFQIHFHLIPQEMTRSAIESVALPYVVLAGFLIMMAIVNAPVQLDSQRISQVSTRDNQIADLKQTIAATSELNFHFHLEASRISRTDLKMRYLDQLMMVGVSTIELVVTNAGQHSFNLVACRWFQQEIPIHQGVSPNIPIRVNITEEIVTALVGDDFNTTSTVVPTTSTLPISIECQAGAGETVTSAPGNFQIEISRATKALNVKVMKR